MLKAYGRLWVCGVIAYRITILAVTANEAQVRYGFTVFQDGVNGQIIFGRVN